jgi:hypothetical protein
MNGFHIVTEKAPTPMGACEQIRKGARCGFSGYELFECVCCDKKVCGMHAVIHHRTHDIYCVSCANVSERKAYV